MDTEIPVGTPLIYDLTLVDGELKAERHYYLGEPQVISPPGVCVRAYVCARVCVCVSTCMCMCAKLRIHTSCV